MLSDTLNLFVSWVTDSLTKRSSTRGLGWLQTSLTRKESGWDATMEVERGWDHSDWSILATPSLCWTSHSQAKPFRSKGVGRTVNIASWMGDITSLSTSLSLPIISCLLHFLLFFLPFCHLSRLSPEFCLPLDYPLFVFSFELRLQVVFSVYSSRYEKLFYPIKGLPVNYLYS